MTDGSKILSDMNDRSREVFRRVVEGYLASGDPVGSRTLTRSMTEKLSAATIRNVMQDLEELGLLREGQHQKLDSLLELSAALQVIAHKTPAHAEAVDAFIAKREPKFGDV